MAATLFDPCFPPSSSSPCPPLPFSYLSLSGVETDHMSFGILPNPVPSQIHGPLCCFMLVMSLTIQISSPQPPTPALSQHQHLRNYWQKRAHELQGNAYTDQCLP